LSIATVWKVCTIKETGQMIVKMEFHRPMLKSSHRSYHVGNSGCSHTKMIYFELYPHPDLHLTFIFDIYNITIAYVNSKVY